MKALLSEKYGLEALELREVDKPALHREINKQDLLVLKSSRDGEGEARHRPPLRAA